MDGVAGAGRLGALTNKANRFAERRNHYGPLITATAISAHNSFGTKAAATSNCSNTIGLQWWCCSKAAYPPRPTS